MANSLQDELLKVGLVTPEQIAQSKRGGKGHKRRGKPRGKSSGKSTGKPSATASSTPSPSSTPTSTSTPTPTPNSSRGADSPRSAEARVAGSKPALVAQVATAENRRRSEKLARDMGLKPGAKKTSQSVDPQRQALRRKLRKLVEESCVDDPKAEIPYYFQRGERVKRLYVTAAQRGQLLRGALVVAMVQGNHYLITAEVGEQVKALMPETFIHRKSDDSVSEKKGGVNTGARTGTKGEDAPATGGKEQAPAGDASGDDPYAAYPVPDDLMW